MNKSDIRNFLIKWNNENPLDRYIRKKKDIIFNSKEHRSINISHWCFSFLEDKMFQDVSEKRKDFQNYKVGESVYKEKVEKENEKELFDKIKF